MADLVVAGVLFMSLESSVVSEPSVTAIARSHWMVERKEIKREDRCEDPFIEVFQSRVITEFLS